MHTLSAEVTDVVRCPLDDHARLFDAMAEHKKYLLRVAYSILHQTEDAEDAVQAAYLSAWSAWASFRGESSLKTWLTTIVMNKSITELRARQRRTWVWLDDDPACMAEAEWQLAHTQMTPEQHAMREQAVVRVKDLLARLPKRTQGIVMLRYMQELSVEEIAQSHGTTHGAVKGHLRRGCQAMLKSGRRARLALPSLRAA